MKRNISIILAAGALVLAVLWALSRDTNHGESPVLAPEPTPLSNRLQPAGLTNPADVEEASPAADLVTEPAPPSVPVSASGDPQQCECEGEWHMRSDARAKAAREAEEKDLGWAYDMEQLLIEFIVSHPAREFELSSVECRTTHCDIWATAPQDRSEQFRNIIREAKQQPWSTVGGSGLNHAERRSPGPHRFYALLGRLGPDGTDLNSPDPDYSDCPCAAPEWQRARWERREAALAAEPKDRDWAYAAEQVLQASLTDGPLPEHFQITLIDCRTTYCDVKAMGTTEQSPDMFYYAVTQTKVENQQNFQFEGSSGTIITDGVITHRARFLRIEPGSER